MEAIEGFVPGTDEAHKLTPEREMEAQEFFDKANSELDKLSNQVLEDVIPNLESYQAKWHPTGFMVFPLGVNPELGSLRLHVWPSGNRDMAKKGETIHDHAWHLASKILVGTYRDELYNTEDSSSAGQEGDSYKVYEVEYKPGEPDRLIANGRTIIANLSEHRKFDKGSKHNIAAGFFHKTTIPVDDLVATLVLDSPAIKDMKARVLIDDLLGEPIYEERRMVSREDILKAKAQILQSPDFRS